MKYPEENNLDIGYYASLVWSKAGLFIAIVLLVATAAVVLSYSLPRKYSATSTVAIEKNVINDLIKGIAITPSMDAKLRILKVAMLSRTMLLEVIKDLDMDLGANKPEALEALIAGTRSKVNVDLDLKRGLFIISFVDKDPRLAMEFVNTLTRKYIEQSTASKRQESFEATRFLGDQIEEFRKRIEIAQQAIDEFKVKNGMLLDLDESALRAEIAQAEDKLQSIRIRKNTLVAQRNLLLRNTPLKRELENLESELSTLLIDYREQHPKVIRTMNAIEAVKQEMARKGEEERKAVYGTSDYQQVRVDLMSAEQMEEEQLSVIEKNRMLIKQIPNLMTELAELQRNKEKEVIIYEQLASRYGQSEVSKQMELQDKSISFQIIDPAVMPAAPTSPNRVLMMTGGIGGGFILAVLMIIGLDFINTRIKKVDQLKALNIPVIAVVPIIRDETAERAIRRKRLAIFCAGACYLGGILALVVMEQLKLPIVDQTIVKITRQIAALI